MRREQTCAQEKRLEERLSAAGGNALEKLCQLGCDRKILGGLIVLLFPEANRLRLQSGREICLHPLDTLDDALKPTSQDMRALERAAERARKLRDEIKELKGTPFVQWLKERGYIDDGDLLARSTVRELIDCQFRGLVNLAKLAKQIGPRKRPDYTHLLTQIFLHVRERTGGWHELELSEILYDLLPDEPGAKRLDLPSWRQRHGLTDSE